MPVPQGDLPRIEVFQAAGNTPTKISFANRWGTEQTERSFFDSFAVPDLSVGFHTIAMEWERDHILWSVDGKEKFQSADGVPRQQMYLLLELATKDASAGAFDIDYVRVYQRPQSER
jgi:beta-glucanase (GH16 family)